MGKKMGYGRKEVKSRNVIGERLRLRVDRWRRIGNRRLNEIHAAQYSGWFGFADFVFG